MFSPKRETIGREIGRLLDRQVVWLRPAERLLNAHELKNSLSLSTRAVFGAG
jgi:hypothetical protein